MAMKNITRLGIFLFSIFFLVYTATAENNSKSSSNLVQAKKQFLSLLLKDALIATQYDNHPNLTIDAIDDSHEGLSNALIIGPKKHSLAGVCVLGLSDNGDNPQAITDTQQIKAFVKNGRLSSTDLLLVHINQAGAFCFNALEKGTLVVFNPDESVVFQWHSGPKLYVFPNNTWHPKE